MVAAHETNLDAAREAGLRTAYIHWSLEWGSDEAIEKPDTGVYDVVADDITDLAARLDA